jgi:putative lipoprotein
MTTRWLIALVSAATICAAAASQEEAMTTDTLAGEWVAELVAGEPLVAGTRVTMHFENGRVFGSGGCNRFQGGYTIEGGELVIGNLASTMMACPEPIMEQERRFHQSVGEAVDVRLENGKLIFENAEGAITRLAPVTLTTLSGTVVYRERMALPPSAVVTVRLLDVSKADVRAEKIAETVVETKGRQVPIPFEIDYDPSRIDPRMTYALEAVMEVDGKMIFRNDTVHPVLTRDRPTDDVEILVVRVGVRQPR